jgi:hypothetical protein
VRPTFIEFLRDDFGKDRIEFPDCSPPSCDLQIRLFFHLGANRLTNENDLIFFAKCELSLAAMHFARARIPSFCHRESVRRLLLQHPRTALDLPGCTNRDVPTSKSDQFTEANGLDRPRVWAETDGLRDFALNLKGRADLADGSIRRFAESQNPADQKKSSANLHQIGFAGRLVVRPQSCAFFFSRRARTGLKLLPRLVDVIPEARYNF